MSMNKIAIIAWHEYSVNVRRIGFIFVTLLFPALGLLGLVVGALFAGQATNLVRTQFTPQVRTAGIVDHSKLFTPIPAQFANRYVEFPDEDTAKQTLLSDKIGSFVVIPTDYLATGKITSYTQGGFSNITNDDPNTLRAFLVSGDGGLGLDVAEDKFTLQAIQGALSQLAVTPTARLRAKRLEAEDFDRLMVGDTPRDLLLWLGDPNSTRGQWDEGKRSAFRNR